MEMGKYEQWFSKVEGSFFNSLCSLISVSSFANLCFTLKAETIDKMQTFLLHPPFLARYPTTLHPSQISSSILPLDQRNGLGIMYQHPELA